VGFRIPQSNDSFVEEKETLLIPRRFCLQIAELQNWSPVIASERLIHEWMAVERKARLPPFTRTALSMGTR
jgi:hypothetical protein